MYYLLTTKVPLRNQEGQIFGLVGISRDITLQKQTEEALTVANRKLIEGIGELEQRSRESKLMSEMIDLLQACMSMEEASSVVAEEMRKGFPGESGALYLYKSSRNAVEQTAAWGKPIQDPLVFSTNDCWGLRRGRTHVTEHLNRDSASLIRCSHIHTDQNAESLCIPLAAQGETLGMLHLRHYKDETDGVQGSKWFSSDKLQRLTMITNSLSLALANLKLRTTFHDASIRDPLTALFNRRYLEESLERELLRAARSQEPVGVMMIDIDHFKQYNDDYGHQAGDTLLVKLAQLLQSCIRGSDVVCRYGGEEFLVMLPETSLESTFERAQQIREQTGHLIIQHQNQVLRPVSLSIGVAAFPLHGQSGEPLIQAADQALYRAKQSGRNRVEKGSIGI